MIQIVHRRHIDGQRAIIFLAFKLCDQLSIVDFALTDADLKRIRPRVP